MPAESLIYLNGRFVPRREATLDVEDRGVLFADGVYEVVRYFAGRPFLMAEHERRLADSLRAIDLPPIDQAGAISDELVRANGLRDATVYWQVTRGAAGPRKHVYDAGATPTVLMIASPAPAVDPDAGPRRVRVITTDDTRWRDCWIKSLMLLPNVLARTAAARAGADEALFVRDGRVTEGTSTSVLAVLDGVLHTHPLDGSILPGVTRAWLLRAAHDAGLTIRERAATKDQLLDADEAMICGTTTLLASVSHVDDRPIGGGAVGPVAARLHRALLSAAVGSA